jgi:hypothetical protein
MRSAQINLIFFSDLSASASQIEFLLCKRTIRGDKKADRNKRLRSTFTSKSRLAFPASGDDSSTHRTIVKSFRRLIFENIIGRAASIFRSSHAPPVRNCELRLTP